MAEDKLILEVKTTLKAGPEIFFPGVYGEDSEIPKEILDEYEAGSEHVVKLTGVRPVKAPPKKATGLAKRK